MPPEALRDAFIDAAETGDDGQLKKLVAKQRDDIRAHFPSWTYLAKFDSCLPKATSTADHCPRVNPDGVETEASQMATATG